MSSKPEKTLLIWDIDDVLNTLMQQYAACGLPENAKRLSYDELTENPPHRLLRISKEDYLSKDLLYNHGYAGLPESTDGKTIKTLPSNTYYFAILGDNYGNGNWHAWVEVSTDSSGLHVVNSAFSFDTPLIVGGGAIPEPSSGILLMIGATLLCLRRKTIC
jgi:hypothetical protein